MTDGLTELDRLREIVRNQNAELVQLRHAVQENHEWHQMYDEYDGYADSELCNINTAALRPSTSHTADAIYRFIEAYRKCGVRIADMDPILREYDKTCWGELALLPESRGSVFVWGSDQCRNCDTGRVTLYAKSGWCPSCLSGSGSDLSGGI